MSLVDELTQTLRDTKDFVKDQAPDVAKQLLDARAIELKFGIAGALSVILALFFVLLVTLGVFPLLPKDMYEDKAGSTIAAFFVSGIQIIPTLCLYQFLLDLYLLKKVPKAYLLKILRNGD